MSLFDYKLSQALYDHDLPFYALLMAAMRRADPVNLQRLRSAFPDVWTELQARYNAPGGLLHPDANDRDVGPTLRVVDGQGANRQVEV